MGKKMQGDTSLNLEHVFRMPFMQQTQTHPSSACLQEKQWKSSAVEGKTCKELLYISCLHDGDRLKAAVILFFTKHIL